nr:unnamed protein product [Spirometra erinaceieuropaei]
MTGVGESESPEVSEKENKIENVDGVRNDNSLSRDFAPKKQSKNNAHLKILVPSIAAGAIIGKGGEAITQIQNSTGAKVKMSKANDFYPGTNERVCLIIGSTDAILQVYTYISEKIFEKPEALPRLGSDGRIPYERHKQVKILVPNSTAGMIIGKGGSFIKEIKDQTGAFIQVSQKSKEMSLAERCELSQTRETMRLLLMKIAEDPQSSSCPNISYMDVAGPVASAYPTGSPYAICVPPSHSLSCSPPGRAAAFLHSHGTHFPGGGEATTGTAGGGFGGGFCPQPHQRGGTSSGGGGGFHPHSPGTGGPIAFPMGPLPVTSPKGGLSPGSAVYEPCGQLGSPTLGTDNTGRLIGQTLAARCGRNGVASGACLPGTSGCLTNRCSTAGPGGGANHQSLLGTASNLWFSNPCSTTLCSPTRSVASLGGSISGPGATTVNQDAIRASLQTAGFTEEAAEEIAHAIQVLNVYGFLSSPNGICGSGGGLATSLHNNRTVAAATRCGPTGGDTTVSAASGDDSSSVNVFKTIVDGNAPPPQRYLSGTADLGGGENHSAVGLSQQRSSSASSPSLSRARSSRQQQPGLGLAALLGETVGLRTSTASAGAGYPCASALPEEMIVTPAVRSSSSTGFYPNTASAQRPSSARPALTASQNDIAAVAVVTTTTMSSNLRKRT